MGLGYVGTQTLSNKLTKILYTHIKHNLPEITKEILERISEVNERLTELGPSMPEDQNDKLQMAWTMVMEFCANFKNAITGKALGRKDRKEVIKLISSNIEKQATTWRCQNQDHVLPFVQGICRS